MRKQDANHFDSKQKDGEGKGDGAAAVFENWVFCPKGELFRALSTNAFVFNGSSPLHKSFHTNFNYSFIVKFHKRNRKTHLTHILYFNVDLCFYLFVSMLFCLLRSRWLKWE